MTTIVEKKGEAGLIFGFMGVAAALVAWRGMDNAPIVSALFALGAIGCFAVIANYYRKPAPILRISPGEIWYGRLDQPGMRIQRNESGCLKFKEGFQKSGWFLLLEDEPDKPGLLMTGFDMREVAAACIAHGWTFG